MGWLVSLWVASFVFAAGNLAEWTTRNMTNAYYYRRGKNGWWFLFWATIFGTITYYMEYV